MHFCNKKEGSGELCILQAISTALYSGVQSCCSTLAHDSLQCFSCNNSLTKIQDMFSLLQELYNILLRKCSHFATGTLDMSSI